MSLFLIFKIILFAIFYYLALACIIDAIASPTKKLLTELDDPLGLKIFSNRFSSYFYTLFNKHKSLVITISILPCIYILIDNSFYAFMMHVSKNYEDFKFFYAVGLSVYKNTNPYLGVVDPSDLTSRLNFPYLPNTFPFLLPLGLIDIDTAFIVYRVFGLITICLFCLGINRLLRNHKKIYKFLSKVAIITTLSILGLTFDVALGNISTITITFIIWFIVCLKENRQIPASIFLALSTIKPTLCIFLFIYILVKKRFRIFFYASGIALMMIAFGLSLANINPLDLSDINLNFITPWENAINTNIDGNTYGSQYISISRIDISVIGARLTKEKSLSGIAFLISCILKIALGTFIGWKIIFSKQEKQSLINQSKLAGFHNLSDIIFFRDISLVVLLTVTFNYSQNTNNSILILPFLFLIIYKLYSYKFGDLNNKFIWNLAMFCIMIHTGIAYTFFGHLYGYNDNYLQSITIGFLPNIAIVVLIICIAFMRFPQNYDPIQTDR